MIKNDNCDNVNKLTVRRLINLLSQAKSLDDEVEICGYNSKGEGVKQVVIEVNYYPCLLNGPQTEEGKFLLLGSYKEERIK